MTSRRGPRTLLLDIETAPSMAYVWSLWGENVPLARLLETGEVLCFAAKWLGERRTEWHARSETVSNGREAMVARAHALMDEADAIIHYNGRSFDMKHLRREFLLAGLTPPSPHKDIDLLATVRREFRFTSNKLVHVLEQLGLEAKGDDGGFDTWAGAMADDPRAWAKMRRYNVRDVRVMEPLYFRLLPWIKGHPHHALYGGHSGIEGDVCANCGGIDLERRGYTYTGVGRYRQYRCRGCGRWSRGRKRVGTVDARGAA